MTKLECLVVNCAYNANKMCKRENITVGGHEARKPSETACKSFSPKGTNTLNSIACGGPERETNIACDAVTCRYNHDKKCAADAIIVAGMHAVTNGETECGTFQSK